MEERKPDTWATIEEALRQKIAADGCDLCRGLGYIFIRVKGGRGPVRQECPNGCAS